MARAAPTTDVDIPLLEEQVDTGLAEVLQSYTPNYRPGGEKKDELHRRFTLFPNRPLPEFDHSYAKAFEARDDFNSARQIYGMVCDPSLPYHRYQATLDLIDLAHPHITTVLGAGPVHCSHVKETRYVIFFERPQGSRLTELMRTQARLHEHKLIDFVLQPAVKALTALREKKVSHGNICPAAFFVRDSTVLGECVSMPCGTLGHYIYEPLERLMADPLAHGEATEKSDIYALAILVLELMHGLGPIKAMDRNDFIEQVMRQGAYQLLTLNQETSETFQDFFRGALNDTPSERWGLDQLSQWLGGKRFNMIAPVTPKEGTRPIVFAASEFFNRRLLAHAFHRNWREAMNNIRNLKLERWCDISLHRPELTERVERAIRNGTERSATERQANDMMTRIIAILDPSGPLRTMSYSLRPDAIGFTLAETIDRNGAELSQLLGLIEYDICSFWIDQQDTNKSPEISQTVWRLQRARTYLKRKSAGFGIERVLYELNPALPCQSQLIKPYFVMTALDALKTLDALASSLAPDTSFVDRHLAAFVACKIDMGKEIRIHDLGILPSLANNPELIMLRLLAKAQQRYPRHELIGLAAWAGMRVEKMIDEIHNRVIRKRLKLRLKKAAQTGSLSEVLGIIINRSVLTNDLQGFSQAIALHQINSDRIARFKNMEILDYKAKNVGGRMATVICNTALLVMGYMMLANLLGI